MLCRSQITNICRPIYGSAYLVTMDAQWTRAALASTPYAVGTRSGVNDFPATENANIRLRLSCIQYDKP